MMSRALTKEKKRHRRRKRDRQREQYGQAQEKVAKEFLQRLGLWDDIRRLGLVNQLLYPRSLRLQVRKADQTQPHPQLDQIVQELQSAINNLTFSTRPPGFKVSAHDLFTAICPLLDRLLSSSTNNRQIAMLLERARTIVASPMSELMEAFYRKMLTVVFDILVKHGRMNQSLYYIALAWQREKAGRERLCLRLHHRQNRPEKFVVDGKPRPAYRCGQPVFPGPIEWISWDRGLLLESSTDSEVLPVFVQQHVFDRIYGPHGRLGELVDHEDLLHDAIWESLRTPVIHPLRDSEVLVEYRLTGVKLGYLVVRLLPKVALVRTFLFLTMDGTPEGNELVRKLRLRRSDKEYLGLDKLATFAKTDLRNDVELVSLLRECGCGGLFDVVEYRRLPQQGRAQEIRKYLNLSRRTGPLPVPAVGMGERISATSS